MGSGGFWLWEFDLVVLFGEDTLDGCRAECSEEGGAEVQVLALLTGLSKVPRVDGIGQLGGFWSSAICPGDGVAGLSSRGSKTWFRG